MNKTKFVPETITLFIKIYLTAIIVFTLFRVILFLTETDRINNSVAWSDILLSFIMGIRFDIVIAGYILLLPFTLLSILSFLNHQSYIISKIVLFFICTFFSLAFLVCAIDIPYFNQFFARFSITAFTWLDSPAFVFKMIIQEPRYWLIILPAGLSIILFFKIMKQVFSTYTCYSAGNIFAKIIWSMLFSGLIFLGIRGRVEEKSPIRVGTAYFSNNAFLNQLGLNPNFTLIKSFLESRKEENRSISLMNDELAVKNVQKHLNISNPDPDFPLLQKIDSDSSNTVLHNVVLIIMESMSTAKMARHGNENNLTPFLDSISKKGYYFENAYTAGIHTYNGIFSSLFSFPAIFRQHPMKGTSTHKYHSILSTLKNHGYSTVYFTTHDGQFDNVEGFLKANDCETVISKRNYPSGMVKTTLGVPDDFMFEFSIPLLNKLHEKNKPFFAAFMTASDHGPYYLPGNFIPKSKDIKNQIVEYADYSLKKFIEMSARQDWFTNTIFVFVADHGAPLDGSYDMSIDYNHTPLLFYAPDIITDHQTYDNFACQIDIFPSTMGLLKLTYTNNTLGINLFKESRPYAFFNADDKYGVIDNEWFLIVRRDNSESLFKYRTKDNHNYASERADLVDQMNDYAKSNMQACQYIIRMNKQ